MCNLIVMRESSTRPSVELYLALNSSNHDTVLYPSYKVIYVR